MPHTHRFRLAACLPLGIPDTSGWVAKLLVRVCRSCDYTEALFGQEHLATARTRLEWWEVWTERYVEGPRAVIGWDDRQH